MVDHAHLIVPFPKGAGRVPIGTPVTAIWQGSGEPPHGHYQCGPTHLTDDDLLVDDDVADFLYLRTERVVGDSPPF